MNINKILDTITALLSSTLVIFFNEKLNAIITEKIFSMFISVIFSAGIALVIEFVVKKLLKLFVFTRRLFYPMAYFEGIWLQIQQNDEGIYAICWI